MTYNADKTWEQLSIEGGNYARTLIQILVNGENAYKEWQSVYADLGGTDASVATTLGVSSTAVAELGSCYAAMKALYDYANNQTPSQSDYLYSLRKFS